MKLTMPISLRALSQGSGTSTPSALAGPRVNVIDSRINPVNEIVLSAHDAGRAFVVGHRYRIDDFRPLLWRTDDFGESWTSLTDGSPGNEHRDSPFCP